MLDIKYLPFSEISSAELGVPLSLPLAENHLAQKPSAEMGGTPPP